MFLNEVPASILIESLKALNSRLCEFTVEWYMVDPDCNRKVFELTMGFSDSKF